MSDKLTVVGCVAPGQAAKLEAGQIGPVTLRPAGMGGNRYTVELTRRSVALEALREQAEKIADMCDKIGDDTSLNEHEARGAYECARAIRRQFLGEPEA